MGLFQSCIQELRENSGWDRKTIISSGYSSEIIGKTHKFEDTVYDLDIRAGGMYRNELLFFSY